MSPSAPWCCYCTTALLFSAVQKVSFFNIFFKSCSTAFQVMSKKKWRQVRGFSKKNERQSENTGSTLPAHTAAGERKARSSPNQPRQLFSPLWVEFICTFPWLCWANLEELSYPVWAFAHCNQLTQFWGEREVYFSCLVNASPELNTCLHKPGHQPSRALPFLAIFSDSAAIWKLIHSPKVQVLTSFVVVSSEKEICISIWIKQNHIYTNF